MIKPDLRSMDASKFIIRGVHLDLTESLYRAAFEKAARLFRLNPRIARVMIDLEIDQSRGPADRFIARGRIHLDGSEMIASAHSENTYKALDLLIETLDALLRTRDTLRAKEEQPAGDLKVAS